MFINLENIFMEMSFPKIAFTLSRVGKRLIVCFLV
ncbi:unknown [Bacteroides sp. CAG:598]|nr:unknown [Bacteroides sp. CAG:598]